MKLLDISDILEGKLKELSPDTAIDDIAIDSRVITGGELFFALRGEQNDGHNFIPQALEKGAIGAVMDRDLPFPGMIVKDTTASLFRLSREIRRLYPIPLIGVAGSSGKTTTKELIALVLEKDYKVIKSEGNQNTQFSLPLMIFKTPLFNIAIAELGVRKPGDMKLLSDITVPNIVVFTHIDKEHLEFFPSFEYVIKEELSIINESISVVYNRDDPFLKGLNGLSYGIKNSADIIGFDIEIQNEGTHFKVLFPDGISHKVFLRAWGVHIVEDALASLAVSWLFKIKPESAIEGIERFSPLWGRMETLRLKSGGILIFDGYNANPLSMKRAIETVESLPYKRRLYIIGDMLELGSETESSHRELGKILKNVQGDIVLIGNFIKIVSEELKEKAVYFTSIDKSLDYIKKIISNYDVILVKASRGMKLERIVKEIDG
ncbi:MAG: UDP-N-acetylmuramoyl-tripeptide--D-alanyl-D-alanine ligase [bacterium]